MSEAEKRRMGAAGIFVRHSFIYYSFIYHSLNPKMSKTGSNSF